MTYIRIATPQSGDDSSPSGELTGRDTGRIPTQEAALGRMVQNVPRAQRLLDTGEYEGADKSFLEQVLTRRCISSTRLAASSDCQCRTIGWRALSSA